MIERIVKQPAGLLLARAFIKLFGGVRLQEQYGVLQRANYAYGLFRAADLARSCAKQATTVCEFGVASGEGLFNMITLGEKITRETGVEFRIVGFDTGEGLPEIRGYQDHPELWSPGDFAMHNKEELLGRIHGLAEIIFGDIKETVTGFVKSLDSQSPLGFISVDVDIYSAAIRALDSLLGPAECYNPAVSVYFDDVLSFFANRWCGELAAIEEFNTKNRFRKIDRDRSLPGDRPVRDATWYQQMYSCHILDHELRTSPHRQKSLSLNQHKDLLSAKFLSSDDT